MKDITITMLGDSITWGLNHCTVEETYTAEFCRLIGEKYKDVNVIRYDGIAGDELKPLEGFAPPVKVKNGNKQTINVIKNGIGGNTVRRTISRFNDYTGIMPSGTKNDVIFIMLGINDSLAADKSKYVSPQKFKEDYSELICMLKNAQPQLKIVLMTPTCNDFSIAQHCEMIRKLAREYGLLLIDHEKVWNNHFCHNAINYGQGNWLSNTKGDATHPSVFGAKIIAHTIFNEYFREEDGRKDS